VLDITDYFLKGVFIYVRLEVDTLEKKKSEAMLCYFIARDLFEEVCMSSRLSNYRCLLPSLRIVATAINNLQQIVNVAKKIESTEQCAQDFEQKAKTYWLSVSDRTKRWLNVELPFHLVSWSYGIFGINYDNRELEVCIVYL